MVNLTKVNLTKVNLTLVNLTKVNCAYAVMSFTPINIILKEPERRKIPRETFRDKLRGQLKSLRSTFV